MERAYFPVIGQKKISNSGQIQDRVKSRTRPSNKDSLRFNGHFSRWTWVSQFYWSKGWWRWWWQLELQVVQSSSQIITTNKPAPSFFTGRMPFLSPNQQRQSTEIKDCPGKSRTDGHLSLGGGLRCVSAWTKNVLRFFEGWRTTVVSSRKGNSYPSLPSWIWESKLSELWLQVWFEEVTQCWQNGQAARVNNASNVRLDVV